jgi:hypothetical protein
MLAESQVSGFFAPFWHQPGGLQPKSQDFSKKLFRKWHLRGCHVFGLFLLPFTVKNTIYRRNNEYKHKILTSEPSILGTPVGG